VSSCSSTPLTSGTLEWTPAPDLLDGQRWHLWCRILPVGVVYELGIARCVCHRFMPCSSFSLLRSALIVGCCYDLRTFLHRCLCFVDALLIGGDNKLIVGCWSTISVVLLQELLPLYGVGWRHEPRCAWGVTYSLKGKVYITPSPESRLHNPNLQTVYITLELSKTSQITP
jgi:hypothetical protein